MREAMAILELWIKSSKSVQEMDTKVSLVRDGLKRIRQEFLKEREGNKDVHKSVCCRSFNNNISRTSACSRLLDLYYARREEIMKQPKRLTRNQREVLSAHNLNWRDWALIEETEFYLKIINKSTDARKILDKFWKGGRSK